MPLFWCQIVLPPPNLHPDFLENSDPRILKPTALSTAMSSWRVSLVNQKVGCGLLGFYTASTTAIWPHVLFAGLFEHRRAAFDKFILGGGPSKIKDFWAKMPGRPGLSMKPRWNELCIPLALHGDGVAISNVRGKSTKTIEAISWTSLLASGPSKFVMFLIWFSMSHLTKRSGFAQTWPAFWRRMCKSLRALFEGTWPAEDMEGHPDPRGGLPLAGGYCAVVYCNRGDLEWMSRQFLLRSSSSTMPCSLCNCTNIGRGVDIYPWTDVNDPPTWLETCVDDEVARENTNPKKPPNMGVFPPMGPMLTPEVFRSKEGTQNCPYKIFALAPCFLILP